VRKKIFRAVLADSAELQKTMKRRKRKSKMDLEKYTYNS
jgi:hypothetical protein